MLPFCIFELCLYSRWTRGTGLMNDNNLVAEEIERDGKVRTFSVAEMAYNILGLLHPKIIELAECAPVYADLNGGMNRIADLHKVTRVIRDDLQAKASLARGRYQESLADGKNYVSSSAASKQAPIVRKRSNFDFTSQLHARDYEKLPNKNLKLGELLDLKQVVVVTGFGEVGPWGNARTRWEMEAYGEFSIEGCIQLAWIMGLIKFQPSNKPAETGGWIDASTGEKVHESQVKEKYEEAILKHCGIRLIEPVMFEGYDPLRKFLTQEVVLNEDMKPIEVSQAEADQFKRQHGDLVQVFKADGLEDGRVLVRFLKGATLFIPKALRFDRFVAGQIPTGWNAERYGVPKDIIDQVDPVTLFVLVSTVEALVSSGITDPYEFYQYVHLAEVGNTSGGGVGGQRSNQKIFRSRFLDKPVQSDILQESFINTMPAWVNLLLLSSAGPIKTPVGACATAVESIDIGVETILSGKAQIIIAGGYDDFREEGSFEFASMEATSNAETEVAKGREPNEMSRPMASSRAGFMESQGAGIQILMTAELALQMGCPIYGIIAAVNTATDKEGRSVPAPGQGILTTARRIVTAGVGKPRILDIDYRVGQLRKAKASIDAWMEEELATAAVEAASFVCKKESSAFLAAATKDIQMEAMRRLKSEQRQWGGFDFAAGDPRIAPVEAALSRFGLTVDDIGVASFHGTGTKANDVNESEVLQKQMEHLGRQPGNLLPAVCQKYLTGHPKAAAAAWMLNGYSNTTLLKYFVELIFAAV